MGFREWSPSALETARTPMTRPLKTVPPAAKIRDRSAASVGLWSTESETVSMRDPAYGGGKRGGRERSHQQ